MTALEHNKFVALAQLGYAVLHLLLLIVMMIIMGVMFARIFSEAERMGGTPPPAFIGTIFVVAGVFQIALTIPSVVAGYALLKRRRWAKVAGIIAGVLAVISFPVGTAVGIYTFWFLFSEPGRSEERRVGKECRSRW